MKLFKNFSYVWFLLFLMGPVLFFISLFLNIPKLLLTSIIIIFVFIIFSILFICSVVLLGDRIRNNSEIPFKSMWAYEQDIIKYMKNNESKDVLENQQVFAMINDFDDGMVIRIKNKKNSNKIFEIYSIVPLKKDRDELIATFWAIMNVYFNSKITYEGLEYWFAQLDNFNISYLIRRL